MASQRRCRKNLPLCVYSQILMADPSRSNDETEMVWVDAWNDLLDLVGDRRDVACLLPDHTVVTVEQCKGWLQDSAYSGYSLTLTETYYEGRKAISANRSRP